MQVSMRWDEIIIGITEKKNYLPASILHRFSKQFHLHSVLDISNECRIVMLVETEKQQHNSD